MFNKLSVQWNYLRTQPGFKKAPLRVLSRLVLWRALCLTRKPAYISLPALGVVMVLPPEWRGVAKLIFVFRDEYEPDLALLERFLTPGSVMVDVGASYGVYSLRASRLVGDSGRIIAFEPALKSFGVLEQNLALNRASNVVCVRMALSDRDGEAFLYHHPDPGRNSLARVDDQVKNYEVVLVRTLDSMLSELGVTKVNFIKVDAEGADELVLRGAQVTLTTFKPAVLFEYNPSASSAMDLEPHGTGKLLASLGYSFYQLRNEELHPVSLSDLNGGNVFALHREAG